MSKELFVPLTVSYCAKEMIRCVKKWKEFSCIISRFVKKKYSNTFTLIIDEKNT